MVCGGRRVGALEHAGQWRAVDRLGTPAAVQAARACFVVVVLVIALVRVPRARTRHGRLVLVRALLHGRIVNHGRIRLGHRRTLVRLERRTGYIGRDFGGALDHRLDHRRTLGALPKRCGRDACAVRGRRLGRTQRRWRAHRDWRGRRHRLLGRQCCILIEDVGLGCGAACGVFDGWLGRRRRRMVRHGRRRKRRRGPRHRLRRECAQLRIAAIVELPVGQLGDVVFGCIGVVHHAVAGRRARRRAARAPDRAADQPIHAAPL